MAWVVSFLRVGVHALTLHQLKDVLSNVRSLARLTLSDPGRSFDKWELLADEKLTTETPGRNVYREARLRETLTDYQEGLTGKIAELCQHKRTVLHISTSFSSMAIPFEIIAGRTYPTLVVNDGSIQEVFLAFKFRLLFILQACAERLRICPRKDCSQVFLKTARADQEYCSRRCGSAVRVRRKREKDHKARQQKMKLMKKRKKGASR